MPFMGKGFQLWTDSEGVAIEKQGVPSRCHLASFLILQFGFLTHKPIRKKPHSMSIPTRRMRIFLDVFVAVLILCAGAFVGAALLGIVR
jgi:hypothetical protein